MPGVQHEVDSRKGCTRSYRTWVDSRKSCIKRIRQANKASNKTALLSRMAGQLGRAQPRGRIAFTSVCTA